jgi:hypothetical protein
MNVKLILICLFTYFISAQNKGISYQAVLLKPVLNMPLEQTNSTSLIVKFV